MKRKTQALKRNASPSEALAALARRRKGVAVSRVRLAATTRRGSYSAKQVTNALFEGDCIRVLESFPDSCVDMVLCDLPYGVTQNKWDSVIPLDDLWRAYWRILKPAGVVVLTAHGLFTARVVISGERFFRYKIVWEKSKPTNFLNAKKQPLRKHEDVCVFYREQPTYNPQMGEGVPYDKGIRKNQLSGSYGDFRPAHVHSNGARYPTDVIYFKTAESEGPVWHPTQKPVSLARYLVRTFTNPGDLVLDNAFGSGSFLVAAAAEDRCFCGIEKNADVHLFKRDAIDYVALAEARVVDALCSSQAPHRHEPPQVTVYRTPLSRKTGA
jgi:site-specific DNA-methyltransferase (adenine-specific)